MREKDLKQVGEVVETMARRIVAGGIRWRSIPAVHLNSKGPARLLTGSGVPAN